MRTKFTKVIAGLLSAVMIISSLQTMAFAAGNDFTNSQLSVVTNKESTLATGVTQNSYTVYDKDGKQVKMFVTTADMNVDTVELFASYKDMNPENYGMSKLTEQVAAFNEKAAAGDEYYKGTVVAGINASYYNMTTGKPTGTFVMNGIDVTTESEGNNYGYFAVMKDGTVKIGNRGEYSSDKGNIQEAIGIYQMLIVDGEICSGLNATTKYPRQTIGITADNKVILMTADGNQAPTSVGLTIQEQAEVMLDLGCVWAGHLDGGGSCTYASKPEGSDSFVITNSPSDGSERSVSNGFIIVSTEAASKAFDRVLFTAENEYVTPGTSISVSTSGASSTGNSAEIPAEVTYVTTNGTFVDGVFTAGSEVGNATITAMYNNKAVGTTTINVVTPDSITFSNSVITVPYGKTVPVDLVAKYGLNEVVIKASDVNFTLSDEAVGTMNNFSFTACEENESITGGTLTAALVADSDVTASVTITLGKGSEILEDYESGAMPESYYITTGYPQYGPMGSQKDANGNYYYNGQNELGNLKVVTAENGKVHDGNYALAVECDFTQPYETGYHQLQFGGLGLEVPANAQTIGMWLYLPELEELWTSSMRFIGTSASGTTVSSPWLWDNCEPYGWENDGWQYVSMDLSGYSEAITFKTLQIYICDRDNSAVNFYFKDHASVNSKFTYYIDNITVDYSSAVDDREAPVFSNVNYADISMSDAVELDGQTVTNNNVSFAAVVKDSMEKTNYTGVDADSVKAYIDGVEVEANYSGNSISIQNAILADGVHTIRFEACDKMGNLAYVERQITVNAASDIPTLSIEPQNPDADKILIGSLYWMNLVSDNAKNVDTAKVTFNLNSVNTWELDHMIVTDGFDASYTIDEVSNNATIIVEKVGEVADDATVLVQLPIRTWESHLTEYEGYEAQTPEKLWSRKIIWPMDIKLSADYGAVTFTDGTEGSFSMSPIIVTTELYGNYGELNENGDYSNKTSWHIHTAVAMDDKAATCTEDGYTGRTFCETCNSVVDWGTTLDATGHTYTVIEGVLKCGCGELFNGEYEDGKTYVDGIALNECWNNDSYYIDGKKLTGVQLVNDYYYDFGEDGICAGQTKHTGLFYDDSVKAYRFAKLGELAGGWHQIEDNWHYFKSYTKVAVSGEYTVNGVTYQFDETGMTKGAWHTTDAGTRYYYGPNYYIAREPGYMTLVDIDGKTYNFDNDGYLTYGIQVLRDSTSFKKNVYEFGSDGAMVRSITEQGPVLASDGATYYIGEEGYVPMNAGLVKFGEDFYYVFYSGKLKQNGYAVVTAANVEQYPELTEGSYYFGEDFKMVIPEIKNGIYEEDGIKVYYVDNVKQTNLGLVKIGDDFYYVCYSGKLKQNGYVPVTEANVEQYPELTVGTYYFGDDCKMVIPEIPEEKNGIYEEDGIKVYYVDGVKQTNLGLVKIGDDFYYVCYSGKLKQNGYVPVTEANVEQYPELTVGTYYFGDDCKMVIPEIPEEKNGIYEEDGIKVYYVDGVKQTNLGLVKIGDDFYYVCYSGKLKQNGYVPVTEANVEQYPELTVGTYYFGDDCKMVITE